MKRLAIAVLVVVMSLSFIGASSAELPAGIADTLALCAAVQDCAPLVAKVQRDLAFYDSLLSRAWGEAPLCTIDVVLQLEEYHGPDAAYAHMVRNSATKHDAIVDARPLECLYLDRRSLTADDSALTALCAVLQDRLRAHRDADAKEQAQVLFALERLEVSLGFARTVEYMIQAHRYHTMIAVNYLLRPAVTDLKNRYRFLGTLAPAY